MEVDDDVPITKPSVKRKKPTALLSSDDEELKASPPRFCEGLLLKLSDGRRILIKDRPNIVIMGGLIYQTGTSARYSVTPRYKIAISS